MEQRFTFGERSTAVKEAHRKALEGEGFTVTEEVFTFHGFTLCTLVAVPPKKEHPLAFTRAEDL